MNNKLLIAVLGSLAFAISSNAGAATITLQPSAAQVAQNGAFTVDLLLNASDAPGSHPGLYGGSIVLDFDPAVITYGAFALAPGVSFFSSPVTGSGGGRATVTLGFENAADVGRVGTFSFTAIGSPGSSSTLNIEDADDFFGSFIAQVPTEQAFYPQFVDASVQVVPLPGAAWMLLTAFGIAGARARRQRTRAAGQSAGR